MNIQTNSVSYDTEHSVTLTVLEWLGIQTQLGLAVHNLEEAGKTATAEVHRGILARLRPQTAPIIQAAADAEDLENAT